MDTFDEESPKAIYCAVECVWESQVRKIGYADFEPSRQMFRFCEFIENDHFTILEAIFLQTQPIHCKICLPDDHRDYKRLKFIAEACDIELLPCPRSLFSSVNLEQDVRRLLNQYSYSECSSIINHSTGGCLSCIFNYHHIMEIESYFGNSKIEEYPLSNFMKMDQACFAALSILPTADQSKQSTKHLLGFLNKCRTVIGSRRLTTWIRQPLTDLEKIKIRHDIVEAFVENPAFHKQVHSIHIRRIPDLDKIVSKFHLFQRNSMKGRGLSLEDLVKLFDAYVDSSKLLSTLVDYDGIHKASIQKLLAEPLNEVLQDMDPFVRLVQYSVDLKAAEQRIFRIHREFDPSLTDLANQLDSIENELEETRKEAELEIFTNAVYNNEDKKIVKLIPDNSMTFVFRVKKKDQSMVQAKGTTFKNVRINKSEFLFTSQKLTKLCRRFDETTRLYEKCQKTLLDKTLEVAATFYPAVETMAEIISTIDILGAFASVIQQSSFTYVRPKIDETGNCINLTGCRHALIEVQDHCSSFIANDVSMYKDKARLLVITGPNMGGKSTFIRQVALVAIMNQIGCFVPCETAQLPLFTQLMCRVGASDVQLRGISTFMAEMIEASAIVKYANDRSLVIVDELGRGTSTVDGFGISWAISEELVRLNCFCLMASHFHELADLANEISCVQNYHVSASFDVDTSNLILLYKVIPGSSDQSYGVQVAKIAGLPDSVIQCAEKKANELEYFENRLKQGYEQYEKSTLDPISINCMNKVVELFDSSDAVEFEKAVIQNMDVLQTFLIQNNFKKELLNDF